MNLHPQSDWDRSQLETFLRQSCTPMRLACVDQDGFPMIASLWFYYEQGELWSATHKRSYLVKQLQRQAQVGFEIATNDYPYRGVRGKALAHLNEQGAGEVLARLIERYLGSGNRKLADWLLSRAQDEYIIRLQPIRINAWDFSRRMDPN